MLPKRLVFCGGGTRCLVFLQGLIELEKKGTFKRVNEYWGTSAGAMVASLYAFTKSSQTVKDIMFNTNYQKFRDIDISNVFGIQTSWGLDDGQSLIQEIEYIFESIGKGNKDKLLSDMPELNIVVSDVTIRETVVCNSQTFPSLRVVDALRASMSLPVFFRPFRHPETGHLWVDGAIKANFPWHCLPNDTARSEALGFAFEKSSYYTTPKTLMEYIFSMIHFDEPKKTKVLKSEWSSNIIWFVLPPFPSWFIRLQKEDFDLIEKLGREGAEKWLTYSNSLAGQTRRIAQASETCQYPSNTGVCPPLCEGPHILKSSSQKERITESSDNRSPGFSGHCHATSPKHPNFPSLSSHNQTPSHQLFYRRWSV